MSDHLPECDAWDTDDDTIGDCICDRLRACEQRVREDEQSHNFSPDIHWAGMAEVYQRGLDAARKAVAAVEYRPTNPETMIRSMALDAIDALRGEP